MKIVILALCILLSACDVPTPKADIRNRIGAYACREYFGLFNGDYIFFKGTAICNNGKEVDTSKITASEVEAWERSQRQVETPRGDR